jgi:hypothetical protein
MRNTSTLLALLAVVLLGTVVWRLTTGGPPGIKTWTICAAGIIAAILALVARRRPAATTTTTRTTV